MTCTAISFQRESLLAEIISATRENTMKLIRYIRGTTRHSAARQSAATERDGIAMTVVEGEQGRTWETALKVAKPGNGILIDSLEVLGRKITTRIHRLTQAQTKGVGIVIAEDDTTHGPDEIPSLITGLRSGVKRERTPRKAHNRTDPQKLAEAGKVWTGDDYAAMSNDAVARATGVSKVTLWREFGPRGRKAGRPRNR
jgi:hypothetical protein